MPLLRAHLEIGSGKLNPASLHDVIEPKVIFEGVCAHNIVVVFVIETKDKVGSLVHLAGDCFELHTEGEIFVAGILSDGQGKAVIGIVLGSLSQDIRLGGRRGFFHHYPLAHGALSR